MEHPSASVPARTAPAGLREEHCLLGPLRVYNRTNSTKIMNKHAYVCTAQITQPCLAWQSCTCCLETQAATRVC